ncbi:MAG: 4-hydroxythreonine-4-phosphate dehydrogenase PdxA [Pirellulaceae bacterium]
MNNQTKPLIAITMGDAAGVGPEVIVAAWNRMNLLANCFVTGCRQAIDEAIELLDLDLSTCLISDIAEVQGIASNTIPVMSVDVRMDEVSRCQVSAISGLVSIQAIELATQLALQNRVAAIVTAPINKEAIRLAGSDYPGHTEMLAGLCGVQNVAMMLYLPHLTHRTIDTGHDIGLGVVHCTLHTALRSVFDELSNERIIERCHLAHEFGTRLLRASGQKRLPRIGVAALNPHAGENGLFGDEEIKLIAPAVEFVQRQGINAFGPLPCDTLMHRAAGGEFDLVVAMYHDQGHIALKLLGLHQAVNITLGLPIIRTSVAHGTAFDIAWTGKAQCESMVAAVESAVRLAQGAS